MFHNYNIRPMLLSEQNNVFQDNNYIYEIKFDGIRALIYVSNKEFKILSRNGNDLTSNFPELSKIKQKVGKNKIIFDGEIIATKNGLPDFSLLQKRSRVKIVSNELIEEIPVTFVAFDILYINKSLLNESLINRKMYLDKFEDNDYFVKSKIYHNGIKLFKMIKKLNLEGVVAKKKNSNYSIGERTNYWIKIKNIKVDNFVIIGYQEKSKTYSLLLADNKNQKLNYVGKVSVNKNCSILKHLTKTKTDLKEKIVYVKPIKKIRVKYLNKTKSGYLRHAQIDE